MADNGDAWYLHLVGAAKVISSKLHALGPSGDAREIAERMLQQFNDPHAGRWLLRNFAYRDIVMSVARNQPPLLCSHHFLRLDEPRVPDSHFGLASEVLEILALTSEAGQHPIEAPGLVDTFNSLESRLTGWACPSSPDISLRLLAESYRSSALIHLYRFMRSACPERQDELSEKVTDQVAVIVSSVEQMPARSLPECTLLFPLFLAGGEAIDESHINSIRNRMLDMIHSRGFRNVGVALSVLEKLWRQRIDASVGRVDWLDIVQQDGIHLSLS